MTASELREAIADKQAKREQYAHRAALLERRCREIRAINPRDPSIWPISMQIEALDEAHDQLGDEIGTMRAELWLLDAEHARRCVCRGLNGSEY